ncbi:MAG: tetratricopeptide repeat protein [Myxococcota bacterium]|jgi:outer membrane protein assembly factor BamD (BamD/ComL family)|nr:tetratricopeptide repeat protein [Myxococcota bacterium]
MKKLLALCATLGLCLLLVDGAAWAQGKKDKKGEDLGKTDVESALKAAAGKAGDISERSEEEKAKAEEERKKALEGLASTPATQESAVVSDVDPARVDELLAEVESKNNALVTEFEQLLAKNPTNANAPEWMFRIAEYKWEIASYRNLRDMREWNKQLEAMEAADVPAEDWPPAPSPDYGPSIEYYKKIVASYASYERLDEVLFKLGDGLIRAGQAKEGVGYLHRLTQAYKDSQYLDLVYLALGEYYFENRNIGTAQASYEKIVQEYPNSRVFNFAQYKLAWTYMNMGDEEAFAEAIEIFKRVVEHLDARYSQYADADGVIDENKLPVGEVSFRNQAINDMIMGYAELENGWVLAKDYFVTKLPKDKLRQKMEMFAELMGERGQFMTRVDIYRWLIGEDVGHSRIPEYAERIIDSHFNENDKGAIEKVTREFIEYFEPNGKWALVNVGNAQAFEQAHRFAEDKLYSLAASYLMDATRALDEGKLEDADAAFAQARADHIVFLRRYPDSKYAYDLNFYYAYILDENSDRRLSALRSTLGKKPEEFRERAKAEVLPDLKAAAEQYQKVIAMRERVTEEQEDHTRVSANRQVFVYANILASVDPDWSLEASGSTRNFRAEAKDSEVREAEPLSEQELDFVKSAEQYAKLFPVHEDTPGFLWRSAEIYRSRYHYNEAAQRFDDLVSNFPQHEYAGQAVGSMFALYNKAENWPKIEYWAEWLINQGNFKVYSKTELEDAIAYSIAEQSNDLYEAKEFRASATKLYTLKSRFPQREELVAPAILGAANIFRDGKAVAEAIEKYEEFRSTYAMRIEAPYATYEAALLYSLKSDFERSAELFEAIPDELARLDATPKPEAKPKGAKKGAKKEDKEEKAEVADGAVDYASINNTNKFVALYNAVQIREGLQQWELAINDARRYLELNTSGEGDIYMRGEDYVRAPSDPSGLSLVVNREGTVYHLAEIFLNAERVDEAVSQYRQYLDAYPGNRPVRIKAHLEIAKSYLNARKGGWERDFGKEMAAIDKLLAAMTPDESSQLSALIAEVRFFKGEQKFGEYLEVKLDFPVRVLRERIKTKKTLREEADVFYRSVIETKVANWSAAAATRIGEMALDFRDGFKNLPIPDEVKGDPDQEDEYMFWIEEELIVPAEEAARNGFTYAVSLAHQLEVYNTWSRKGARRLAELSPDAYPVLSEVEATTNWSLIQPTLQPVMSSLQRGPKEPSAPAASGDQKPNPEAATPPAAGDAQPTPEAPTAQ